MVSMSDIIIAFFLPILSASIPAIVAPIVAPRTAVLTTFLNKIVKIGCCLQIYQIE